MRTVTFATQKGGSGKSTLCRHLAVAAVQAGMRASILDTDPQNTVRCWDEARRKSDPPAGPPTVEVELSSDRRDIDSKIRAIEADGAEWLFIGACRKRDSAGVYPTLTI